VLKITNTTYKMPKPLSASGETADTPSRNPRVPRNRIWKTLYSSPLKYDGLHHMSGPFVLSSTVNAFVYVCAWKWAGGGGGRCQAAISFTINC
jgi:hypothetical protein